MLLFLFSRFSTVSNIKWKSIVKLWKIFFLKKSQICRNVYMFRINEFNNDQLMFLNENAVNEHIMNRKYDWSSFEFFFSLIRSVKKSKKFNILSVYTLNEILIYHIYQKLIINARFEWFFRTNFFFDTMHFSISIQYW